ncbi:hypothetical protein F0L68_01185 [Solihabitans fulvus]|uniref:Excreted virulence factor EspC, type VII ESX diderm n=1 Tax=Solihabitans fulvus TaxID=1892852 RepID=A0A5B2XWX8_9PSEU|nr:hypothetical protein [Solihabitans fulvus]KAA2267171.1 hypothetical protein F0L68_01185 [Solihabitans fulvus]
MTGISLNNDGVIDMYPEETRTQLNKLKAAGEDLATAWRSAKDSITNPGAVGQGPLGAKFLAQYTEAKDSIIRSMDCTGDSDGGGVSGVYQGFAEAGGNSVRDYEAAEVQATNALSG